MANISYLNRHFEQNMHFPNRRLLQCNFFASDQIDVYNRNNTNEAESVA